MRDLQRRLSQAEKRLAGTHEIRMRLREQRKQRFYHLARTHAIIVAGILLHGKPKSDEPLAWAWARTMAYNVTHENLHEKIMDFFISEQKAAKDGIPYEDFKKDWVARQDKEEAECWDRIVDKSIYGSWEDYEAEAKRMRYRIMGCEEKEEAARFTEIFRTAPVWLLTFTYTSFDAGLLNFGLPDLSAAHEWGEIGLRDSWRWPMLPLGIMTEGAPITPKATDLSAEEWLFLLVTTNKPLGELSRMERVQMLALEQRLSGQEVDAALTAKIESRKRVQEFYSKFLKLERAREPPPFSLMSQIVNKQSIPIELVRRYYRGVLRNRRR